MVFTRSGQLARSLKSHLFAPYSTTVYRQPGLPSGSQRLLSGDGLAKLGVSAAVIGGTAFGINAFLNRETRNSMPPFERDHLNKTFTYAGTGLGLTAITAKLLHNNGFSYRLMSMNPWLVMGGSLALSLGTMYGTVATPESHTVQKHAFWAGFNIVQAGILAPVFFFSPQVLSRAALYTCGIVGSLAYVGATAKEQKYLYMGGPLLAGVSVVVLSGLAPLLMPRMSARALAMTEAVYLYGGLAVFSGFILYDTQKILEAARVARMQGIKPDAVAQSVSIELDAINIFVRMAMILQGQQQRRK